MSKKQSYNTINTASYVRFKHPVGPQMQTYVEGDVTYEAGSYVGFQASMTGMKTKGDYVIVPWNDVAFLIPG